MIRCVCELLVFEDYMLFCFPFLPDSSAFATCAELVLIDVTWPIWILYSDPFSLKNSSSDMFICFKPFQPSALLSCEMEQKTCGMGEAIGGEKPGPSVKYVMAVELERVYYCWIFPEMLFPSKINCTLEQAQILCSPPLLLITKVSEAAWSGMHLNIFFCHLRGGACPQGLESCLPVSLSASSPQLQCTLFQGLAFKINYTVEVREKTKADLSASRQVDSPMAQRVNALATPSITGTAIT